MNDTEFLNHFKVKFKVKFNERDVDENMNLIIKVPKYYLDRLEGIARNTVAEVDADVHTIVSAIQQKPVLEAKVKRYEKALSSIARDWSDTIDSVQDIAKKALDENK